MDWFISKRTLRNNVKVLTERNLNLNKFNVELQRALRERDERISDLLEKNRQIEGELVTTSEILDTKQKEVKRLKTLLTRNNIQY